MFEYSEVAVEIWHQILLAVIDLPYLLDTHLEGEVDLWRNSSRYHDHKVYAESEHQRKTLRLVCHSWRNFADEYKYRWITYDSRSEADPATQKEALEAIQSTTSHSMREGTTLLSKPRRIMFHVANDLDMELFRRTVDHSSQKVTTFFVKCADGYEDQVFEYVISQHSRLPILRCLAVHAPTNQSTPLRAISKAFPRLVTFALWNDRVFCPRDGDILTLPELEELELDLSVLDPDVLKKWHLPGMINLTTPVAGDLVQGSQLSLERILERIRSLGTNLTYINIYRVDGPIRLPIEFWTWCPCLIEFLCFFSWIYLDNPVPLDHPLKYVVHWPHYDGTANPLVEATSHMTDPAVLLSLQCLPPGLKFFIVWHRWSAYLELLATGGRYNQREREDILVKMNKLCLERSIRVEDEHRVGLDEFMVSESIGKMDKALELLLTSERPNNWEDSQTF